MENYSKGTYTLFVHEKAYIQNRIGGHETVDFDCRSRFKPCAGDRVALPYQQKH